LELNALRYDVALHSFLFEAFKFFESLSDGLLSLLFKKCFTSFPYSIHKFRLKKVVEGIKIETFVEEIHVYLAG